MVTVWQSIVGAKWIPWNEQSKVKRRQSNFIDSFVSKVMVLSISIAMIVIEPDERFCEVLDLDKTQ